MQKKKRMEVLIFALYDDGALILTFYFNVTFLLSYFCMTKSTKSHLRGFSILLKIFFPVSATPTNALRALVHSRVHELVARAMRGKCVQ